MSSAGRAGDDGIRLLSSLGKEQLIKIIVDDAKNWLAHDGVWFQAVERRYGMAAAIDADTEAWVVSRPSRPSGSWSGWG